MGWLWLYVLCSRATGIVIAMHCAEGILVGADSLETSQSVLVDQLYAEKIHQVSPTAYLCLPTMDIRGFQLCKSLRVVAKRAMLRGKALKVSELAAYAQNLVAGMKGNPHFLVVGNEDFPAPISCRMNYNREESEGLDYVDESTRECQQKIFEMSPSGFLTEQSSAAIGISSESALMLINLSRHHGMKASPKRPGDIDPFIGAATSATASDNDSIQAVRRPSMRRATTKILKTIQALKTSDANINGKVRMYLIPNSAANFEGIVSIKSDSDTGERRYNSI